MSLTSGKHLGHLLLEALKERPSDICQIDAATGEEETNESVLRRSINLAQCLSKFGLAPGDVLALDGRNHLDLHIPYYAALLHGLAILGVDPLFKIDEIKALFKLTSPKIAFCDPEHYDIYVQASADLGLNIKIVAFGTGPNSMQEFIEKYENNSPIEEFEATVLNPDKNYAWLVSSGGTSGIFKVAALTHASLIFKIDTELKKMFHIEEAGFDGRKLTLNLSPVQWVSGFFFAIALPLLGQTKLQTSAPPTTPHVIDIINKYKPVSTMIGPSLATSILKQEKPCDLSSFKQVIITGGKVYTDLLFQFRKAAGIGTRVVEMYGQTENIGPVFTLDPYGPAGTCGFPSKYTKVRLVDPGTGREVTEPNVTGELWTKPVRISEYYKNPEETAKVLSEDGWYKTGDLLYRDENNNYYFVERLSMLIKYKNYHVLPPELEEVIRTHEGVLEVSVTSIPHEEDGEHPVACVVRKPGSDVSAQQIKDLVADKLSETKQLRGGVAFVEALPMTSAGKVARSKLRAFALNSHRE